MIGRYTVILLIAIVFSAAGDLVRDREVGFARDGLCWQDGKMGQRGRAVGEREDGLCWQLAGRDGETEQRGRDDGFDFRDREDGCA